MTGAESLARSLDAGKKHLGGYGDINQILSFDPAVVAHPAIINGMGLAEIIQQRDAAAQIRLGKSKEGAEQDIGNSLFLLIFLLNEVIDFLNVPVTEQQEAMSRQTVPPGPSDLLIIRVNALGKVIMDNESDIRLVDPHAEGDRCHDDPDVVPGKQFLILCARDDI